MDKAIKVHILEEAEVEVHTRDNYVGVCWVVNPVRRRVRDAQGRLVLRTEYERNGDPPFIDIRSIEETEDGAYEDDDNGGGLAGGGMSANEAESWIANLAEEVLWAVQYCRENGG